MNTILVVDDQPTVVYSLKRLLQMEGYQVITAEDGRGAIKLAASRKPDLVIMDVRMPGMDGLTALARIKKEQPQVQVIMMTAYSTIDKAIEAMKQGAFDYLAKPFDNEELLSRVRDALKSKELVGTTIVFDGIEEDTVERVIGKSPQMLTVYKQVGVDQRGKRNRQGTHRPGNFSSQRTGEQTLPGDELRRHPRAFAGK